MMQAGRENLLNSEHHTRQGRQPPPLALSLFIPTYNSTSSTPHLTPPDNLIAQQGKPQQVTCTHLTSDHEHQFEDRHTVTFSYLVNNY